LKQAIPVRREPREQDRMLLGRVAEVLGYPEIARAHYGAIKADTHPLSVGWMATRRLEAMAVRKPR